MSKLPKRFLNAALRICFVDMLKNYNVQIADTRIIMHKDKIHDVLIRGDGELDIISGMMSAICLDGVYHRGVYRVHASRNW